jgi:hypothetical protein
MNPPLHPDRTKSVEFHDEQNEHFMYLFYRRQKELEDRATSHIKIAKTTIEKKKGKSIYSNASSTETNDTSIEATKIDEETGLMYGLVMIILLNVQPELKQNLKETLTTN